MSQRFVDVISGDNITLLAEASSNRGTVILTNYGNEVIWIGTENDPAVDQGISIAPNGGSYTFSNELGTVTYRDISATHGGEGPQQVLVEEKPQTFEDVRALHDIGIKFNISDRLATNGFPSQVDVSFDGEGFYLWYNKGFSGQNGDLIVSATGRYEVKGTISVEQQSTVGLTVRMVLGNQGDQYRGWVPLDAALPEGGRRVTISFSTILDKVAGDNIFLGVSIAGEDTYHIVESTWIVQYVANKIGINY